MLTIEIPAQEFFDRKTNEFTNCPACTLKLEHSLISISKWEEQHKKPFLKETNLTVDEFLDYIRCMTVNQGVPDVVYKFLTADHFTKIKDYITDPATATTITDRSKQKAKAEIPTSELLYYHMFSNGIPKDCEKWRLNRLIMLIRIFAVKGNPQKMTQNEIYAFNAALNNSRRGK